MLEATINNDSGHGIHSNGKGEVYVVNTARPALLPPSFFTLLLVQYKNPDTFGNLKGRSEEDVGVT